MSTSSAMISPTTAAAPYHHGKLRETLLQRAAEVIGSQGIEALSLRALARDIGVSHAAPARHFPTRNDLLAALAEEGVDRLIAATEAEIAGCGSDTAFGRIRATARAYLCWAQEHPAHYNAVRNPEVMRHARPSLKSKMAAFAARQRLALEQAQSAGWSRDVDLNLLMFQFVASLTGSATVMTDPTYREVLTHMGDAGSIDRIVDAVFPSI